MVCQTAADSPHAFCDSRNGSPLLYLVGIGLTFVSASLSQAIYALVALIWLVPDKRIERVARRDT